MNTLGYVARQFDVLASPKSSANGPNNNGIPRVNSWSAKSLFSTTSLPLNLKRSQSSPAFSTTLSNKTKIATSSKVVIDQSKPIDLNVLDHIFFIRVFLLLWDHLKSAWSSLKWRRESQYRTPPTITTTSSPTPSSRTPTPLPIKKTPFHQPKTLVLDLDETLIHSTSRPIPSQSSLSGTGGGDLLSLSLGSWGRVNNKGAGHTVEVVLGGRSTLYHVYKRPFVDFFLRTVSGWYTLVIFTASMREYADPVIDWLDAGRGILAQRFFRDSCTQLPNGSYTKDLTIVESDLSRICLIDNSPISYTSNEANGIPIEGWTFDPSDEALLDLLPVLDSLRFTSDVRRVLGLRRIGAHVLDSDS